VLSSASRFSATATSESHAKATAWHQRDLCVDVAQLALNRTDFCVGSRLSVAEARQLLRLLVFHAGAIEGDRVAVQAIRAVSVFVQLGQRARQLTPSFL
jgi:hypothetical protein